MGSQMIVGFNHNIGYRGVGFHVQTEDSRIKTPQMVTILYHGGTIIASQKTVYADILKVDNLQQVVEDLAKEQHKGMLRRLTKGEFDEKILSLNIPLDGVAAAKHETSPKTPQAKIDEAPPEVSPAAPEPPASSAPVMIEEPLVDKFQEAQQRQHREPSLDELIYAYLTGADEC